MVGVRPWGLCSVCGHKRSLRHDGLVRTHRVDAGIAICEGSLKPPKKEQ